MLTMKKKFRTLSHKHKLNARSLREIVAAMRRSVRIFKDDGEIKFRDREFGGEAFINCAVWYLVDLDRSEQERILRTYLPRIEAYLVDQGKPDARQVGRSDEAAASDHTDASDELIVEDPIPNHSPRRRRTGG